MAKPRQPDEFKELIYDAFCHTECPYIMGKIGNCTWRKNFGGCQKFQTFCRRLNNAFRTHRNQVKRWQDHESLLTKSESNATQSQPSEAESAEQTT